MKWVNVFISIGFLIMFLSVWNLVFYVTTELNLITDRNLSSICGFVFAVFVVLFATYPFDLRGR